ncbi:MAG: hypothetical protein QOE11_2879 [Solirubrobacteraceae bacterium]|jgi:hypothetical protein|nr:hypothetical protein [Solirubrobacteraceae bacterium]
MRQTRPDSPAADAAVAVGAWRRRRLAAAGFEPGLAAALAEEPAVDLHELLVLLDRGCPPALAARILAPLDAGTGGP